MANKKIKSAFSPYSGEWDLQWPARLSQHDLVYLSPPDDPLRGIPLGNGDCGALVHTDGGKLILNINKCDLWDIDPNRTAVDWKEGAPEKSTMLRHAGKLTVDFRQPIFDMLYLNDFTGRLHLSDAAVEIKAETAFASVAITAFYAKKSNILCVKCVYEGEEDIGADVTLERWGSRGWGRWYSGVTRDASLGLGGTSSKVSGNSFLIRQKLRTIDFTIAATVAGEAPPEKLHERSGRFSVGGGRKNEFIVYLTVVSSADAPDTEAEALKRLDMAGYNGFAPLLAGHVSQWSDFWEKSFIDVPDKYIENLWYLNLYFANSSCGGAYPPHFSVGLWGFTGDFIPWKDFFHWNMQWFVHSMFTPGHSRLADPYMSYRRNQLELCKACARKFYGKQGALYSDICDAAGYGKPDGNFTPGPQIAMDMWRYYRFTGDGGFLRGDAWPVMRETARFYADMLERDEFGVYHLNAGSAYEGSPLFKDAITDIASIKALFPAAIKTAGIVGHDDMGEIAKWRDIQEHIADYAFVELEDDEFIEKDGLKHLVNGIGRELPLETTEVFAAGFSGDVDTKYLSTKTKNAVRNRWADGRDMYYGIPDPELAVVFPSGSVGMGDKNTRVFRAAVNQAGMHRSPGDAEQGCAGWCPYPIVLARLGMAGMAAEAIQDTASYYQRFCQGFGHWQKRDLESESRFFTINNVHEHISRKDIEIAMWPFRHFYHEAVPIVCIALSEMLIQSYGGAIRVCAAIPGDWDADFRLFAEGGFRVDCSIAEGAPVWVCIEKKYPGDDVCAVICPWGDKAARLTALECGGEIISETDISPEMNEKGEPVYRFKAVTGRRYLLSDGGSLSRWETQTKTFARNEGEKKLGNATLGLRRLF